MKFVVEGKPFGKQRPRSGLHGFYTPRKTHDYEDQIAWEYKKAGGIYYGKSLFSVKLKVFHSIPTSFSKKKTKECEEWLIRPTKKPDVDNVLKAVFDALNKVCWYDDAYVIFAQEEKYYSTNPRVEVEIEII